MSKSNRDDLTGSETLGTSKAKKPSSIPIPKNVVTSAMTTRSMAAKKPNEKLLTNVELIPSRKESPPRRNIPMDLGTSLSSSQEGRLVIDDINVGSRESSSVNMALFDDTNRNKIVGSFTGELAEQISVRTFEWNQQSNSLSVPSRPDTIESLKESVHKSRRSKVSIGSTTMSEKIRIRELDQELALAKIEMESQRNKDREGKGNGIN